MKYKFEIYTDSEEEKETSTKMKQNKEVKATDSKSTSNGKNKGKNAESGMKNILSIHHFDDYLFEEYLKKIRISEVPIENIGNYTRIPGNKRRINDNHTKFIIDKSVSDTVKRKINYYAFYGESKRRLMENLVDMRHDRNKDFVIFITNLNETFDELEELGESFSASNMIIYRKNFEECVNQNENRERRNVIISVKSNKRKSKKNNKIKYTNKKERSNIKCVKCSLWSRL
ncbi:hypothetical protein H8356DRAFT_1432498 [Neocallimastix lanati (nom. inval.)]|nr:hypothetical protein H8356DRAFT_1432498 [Neocallimastix sp. JGI-2020a]